MLHRPMETINMLIKKLLREVPGNTDNKQLPRPN